MSEGKLIVKKAKGIIFDLDGTLVDSMSVWKEIDVIFLAQHGYKVPADLHEAIEGMSFTETAEYFKKRFALSQSIEGIKDCWNQMAYEKYCNEIALKPGAEAFLSYVYKLGCKIAIASSNSHTLIQAVLKSHNIASYFSAIVTSCDVKAGKPAPDVYLKAAELLALSPSDCVVFEDVPAGIMAGKAAGMKVFAVEDAFSEQSKEKKLALADGWVSDYTQLISGDKEDESKALGG